MPGHRDKLLAGTKAHCKGPRTGGRQIVTLRVEYDRSEQIRTLYPGSERVAFQFQSQCIRDLTRQRAINTHFRIPGSQILEIRETPGRRPRLSSSLL
jgi:hypothetical protein